MGELRKGEEIKDKFIKLMTVLIVTYILEETNLNLLDRHYFPSDALLDLELASFRKMFYAVGYYSWVLQGKELCLLFLLHAFILSAKYSRKLELGLK